MSFSDVQKNLKEGFSNVHMRYARAVFPTNISPRNRKRKRFCLCYFQFPRFCPYRKIVWKHIESIYSTYYADIQYILYNKQFARTRKTNLLPKIMYACDTIARQSSTNIYIGCEYVCVWYNHCVQATSDYVGCRLFISKISYPHVYTFFGYAVYETDKRRRKKAPRRSLQHYIFCSVVV